MVCEFLLNFGSQDLMALFQNSVCFFASPDISSGKKKWHNF